MAEFSFLHELSFEQAFGHVDTKYRYREQSFAVKISLLEVFAGKE